MKKLLLPLLVLFLISSGYSQSVKIGIGGGLSLVQSPDSWTNEISTTSTNGGVGFNSEFNIAAKGRLNIPLLPVTPTVSLNYYILNGSASTAAGEIKTSGSIFSLGAGVELSLVPGPLSPYAALDIMYNNIGEFKRETPLGSTTFAGVSRMGIGIGAGINFNLLPMVDLDLGAKYQLINLVGKESGEETVGIINLNLLFSFGM